MQPNKLPWVANWNGFQCIMSISCPGPDGFQNIMTSVSYCFPHGLIERRVIIKWFYRLYCIVSHEKQCTNGKLKYILVKKMGTTLTEEYGTTYCTVVRPNIFGLIGYYSTNGNSPAIRKPWKLWHVLVLHVACLGWKIIKGVLIWTAGENASESTCLKSKGFKLDSENKTKTFNCYST